METIGNPWLWAGFGGLVVIALLVDLVLMRHGGPHRVTFREALLWSIGWVALALLFDLAGAGAPFWWAAGKSLEALLALAHWTAAMPGAVSRMPGMGQGAFALFNGIVAAFAIELPGVYRYFDAEGAVLETAAMRRRAAPTDQASSSSLSSSSLVIGVSVTLAVSKIRSQTFSS